MNSQKPHIFYLILLISFPSACAVFLTPALPQIAHEYAVSPSRSEWLIAYFLVGYATGQLLYSPIANRYGRKKAIYTGLTIYFISVIMCLSAQHFSLLLIGRLLMAIGSSVGMVISFTIIHDYYPPKQTRSIIGYTVLAYAFMPALAVFVGGLISRYLGVKYIFMSYLFYGIIILLVTFKLPETFKPEHFRHLRLKPLFSSYLDAFTCRRLVMFAAIYGLMSGFIYVIASDAPFVGIKVIGLSPAVYGSVLLLPYLGQLIGSITAGRMGQNVSHYTPLFAGFMLALVGSIAMFICFYNHFVNTYTLLLPIFIIMLGLPMTYSAATSMALHDYPDKATGAAVMSFLTMGINSSLVALLSILPIINPIILPLLFLGIICLAASIIICSKKLYPFTNEIA